MTGVTPSAAASNHPPAVAAGAAVAVGCAAATADAAADADGSGLTPDSAHWRAYEWLRDTAALPPRAAGQLMRRAVALAEVYDNDKGTGAGAKMVVSAAAVSAAVTAAVTAAASRSAEWYVDVCVSDAVSWHTPWGDESVAPGAVFERMCTAYGFTAADDADAHTDVETVQWIVRALLCMRLVWTPPSGSAAGAPEWPAVVSGERDASIFTLHTVCVPRDAPRDSTGGDDDSDSDIAVTGCGACAQRQYRYASPIVCASLLPQPLVCTALLQLPAYCGLDVSLLDPTDGSAVWWACAVPQLSLVARLLRVSSDAALNAQVRAPNRTRCSLLHAAVTGLLLQPNATTARVVELCCDAAVRRNGSGVDLFALFRRDPTALTADPGALTAEELSAIAAVEHATADRALTAFERVVRAVALYGVVAASDLHLPRAMAALSGATSCLMAYATGVRCALADAFASPSASAASTHLPRPLQDIVLDYALQRRA